jgi:23S rRNA (guanosine2251-2'-O)-methyltransferase
MNIYGIHAVRQFLRSHPARAKQLCIQKTRGDDRAQEIASLAREVGVPVSTHPREKLEQLASSEHHQGVVLSIKPTQIGDEKSLKTFCEELPSGSLFLILDGIKDPHNLGACLRSAAAFDVAGVIWPKDKQASVTPLVRKVASGAVDILNLFAVTNLNRSIETLKQAGVWTVGTLLDEEAQPIQSIDMRGSIGIVMGAEGEGLRKRTQEACDHLAYISMPGTIQSLNVSVATGIALYEAQRQRLQAE